MVLLAIIFACTFQWFYLRASRYSFSSPIILHSLSPLQPGYLWDFQLLRRFTILVFNTPISCQFEDVLSSLSGRAGAIQGDVTAPVF